MQGIVSEDSEAMCDQGYLNVRRSCDLLCTSSFSFGGSAAARMYAGTVTIRNVL